MKKLAFLLSIFIPSLLFAQPKKGDLLIGLSMHAQSSHSIFQENNPGDIGTSASLNPRLGYLFSERTLIGFSPSYSLAHFQSLDQFGAVNRQQIFGAELFFRKYLPIKNLIGTRLFGEVSGHGNIRRNKNSRNTNPSKSNTLEGDIRLGLSQQISRGLYFELMGEYTFFAHSKFDNVTRYSTLWPNWPFNLTGSFQIFLEDGRYMERAMPKSRIGWKSIGGSLSATPARGHIFGIFNRMKFVSERLLVGFGSNFGFRVENENSHIQAGIGPAVKYILPMTPRFSFLAAFDGRYSMSFPVLGGSQSLRRNYINASLGIGTQFFLNQNLALEVSWKRPYFWRKEVDFEYVTHSGKWKVLRFDWELVYYFK